MQARHFGGSKRRYRVRGRARKAQSLLDSHLANGTAVPTSQLKRELDAVETEYRNAQNPPAVKMSR